MHLFFICNTSNFWINGEESSDDFVKFIILTTRLCNFPICCKCISAVAAQMSIQYEKYEYKNNYSDEVMFNGVCFTYNVNVLRHFKCDDQLNLKSTYRLTINLFTSTFNKDVLFYCIGLKMLEILNNMFS